jgi:hypothetical protein
MAILVLSPDGDTMVKFLSPLGGIFLLRFQISFCSEPTGWDGDLVRKGFLNKCSFEPYLLEAVLSPPVGWRLFKEVFLYLLPAALF